MLDPKFKRLGKPGHIWPGVWRVPKSYDQAFPWRFNCPAPLCFYHGGYTDEIMANKMQETHTCPWFGGGKTTLSWGIMSDMFLVPIWKKLDDAVDDLMAYKNGEGDDYVENIKLGRKEGTCRGLAEALADLMPPFFHTGDEVVQEAMVRYEKRQAGEDYETPGLGRLRFKVPPGAELMTPAGIPHELVVGTKSEPEHHPASIRRNHGLSEEKVAEILKQSKQGFDARMLAMFHETTEAVIKNILKSNAKA